VKRSSERILTTHTGSLPRPDDLLDLMRAKENDQPYDREALAIRVRSAVIEAVHHQVECGVDVVGDGEQSKSGFASYQVERLSGFAALPPSPGPRPPSPWKEVAEFPEYYDR
jgi:5-methyltetrahydropteroyltriglutamate--homocysteine methyltransferase